MLFHIVAPTTAAALLLAKGAMAPSAAATPMQPTFDPFAAGLSSGNVLAAVGAGAGRALYLLLSFVGDALGGSMASLGADMGVAAAASGAPAAMTVASTLVGAPRGVAAHAALLHRTCARGLCTWCHGIIRRAGHRTLEAAGRGCGLAWDGRGWTGRCAWRCALFAHPSSSPPTAHDRMVHGTLATLLGSRCWLGHAQRMGLARHCMRRPAAGALHVHRSRSLTWFALLTLPCMRDVDHRTGHV